MKQPKSLFRRPDSHVAQGRATTDHESVPIPPPVDVPEFRPERHVVHVPVARFIELDCDHCLRALEHTYGVRVDRSKGSSAIDIARNIRATDALVEGFESVLFIDSDMLFDPADAVRLFMSPEPVIAGLYAAKKLGNGQVNCNFEEGVENVRVGTWAAEPYPIQAVGAGFLRIKTSALRHVAKTLNLPYCNMAERRAYPFFQPMIVEMDGTPCYLGEDYSFIHRCRLAGLRPVVDTSFRLWHIGDYAYGIEEAAGQYIERSRNLLYQIGRPKLGADPRDAEPPALD